MSTQNKPLSLQRRNHHSQIMAALLAIPQPAPQTLRPQTLDPTPHLLASLLETFPQWTLLSVRA
jgi:hypothetical protein